jgi:hypothetical protein
MVTIVRERHPFEGQSFEVVQRRRYSGESYLLLRIPDGSRLRVPANWTRAVPSSVGPSETAVASIPPFNPKTIASIEMLLKVRNLVDSLLRQVAKPEVNSVSSGATRSQRKGEHANATSAFRSERQGHRGGPVMGPIRISATGDRNADTSGVDDASHQRRSRRSRSRQGGKTR